MMKSKRQMIMVLKGIWEFLSFILVPQWCVRMRQPR